MTSQVRLLCRAGLALALLAMAGTGVSASIDWTFAPASCSVQSDLAVSCGSLGVLHLGNVSVAGACATAVTENVTGYPLPAVGNQTPQASVALADAGTLVDPWILVVDFDGDHMDSVAMLVDEMSGPGIDVFTAPIDDAQWAGLGQTGDFHLAATLCDALDRVDAGTVPAPLAINMSFGRAKEAGDPQPGITCTSSEIACRVSEILDAFRQQGTQSVAAAGNHRKILFPALLEPVLAVSMLDMRAFSTNGTTVRSWESPNIQRALFPGQALCIGSDPVWSGASYAAAIASGWIAKVRDTNPGWGAQLPGAWRPHYDAAQSCYRLARGNQVAPGCNTAFGDLIDGLEGGYDTVCWNGPAGTPVASLHTGSVSQPQVPGFADHVRLTSPTPEADPCVPCTGTADDGTGGGSGALTLNMSQSTGVEAGTTIDTVYLRVGTSFYPISLSQPALDDIESGSMSSLVVASGGILVSGSSEQSSLWFEMDDGAGGTFWLSTPITVVP